MKKQLISWELPSSRSDLFVQVLALPLLLLLTTWVYWQGLSGPLVLDDYGNLITLGENGGVDSLQNLLRFVTGNESGPTGRPVAMLSFLIDSQDWPPFVPSLKYTNLMIHLLSGVVIFWLSLTLFEFLSSRSKSSVYLALLVTALWLLHPLNVSTTLYVVQRMTQLMTLFALAAILCYVRGRLNLHTKPRQSLALLGLCLFPFGLLAVLSKENGALLLLMIVVMEVTLFSSVAKTRLYNYWYRLGVLLPLVIIVLYLAYDFPNAMADYEGRVFSMGERLLTQLRILSSYIFEILLPNISGKGLFHDDIQASTGLLTPMTTLFSALFILSLAVAGIALRNQTPVLSFALLWFFGMHLLESTYLPLELYFEHRNYMAMIGPLIAIVWYGYSYAAGLGRAASIKLVAGIYLFVLSIMTWSTWQLALQWGDTPSLFGYWALENPASSRAQANYADFLADSGAPELALERMQIARDHYPNEATLLLHSWNIACEYQQDSPLSLARIAEMEDLEYYRDDIAAQLRRLLEGYLNSACAYPDPQELVAVFDRVDTLPLVGGMRATYHQLFSDLYVSLGQLDSALIQLSRSTDVVPNPQIHIRQAILAASAGQYSNGLIFLERAREADGNRTLLKDSNLVEIERLERDFNRLLQAQ